VHDGFRLWIGGSIVSTGVVDAYEVFCRKDLIAKDGIIGRQRALVRVAGRVQAKYVENCTVESKSSVYIHATVFNSRIFTLDRLVMAEKGRLIGGQVRCAHGVVTDEIGNEAGVVTEVITGIDFIVERKLAAAKEKFQELTLELQKLDKTLTRGSSAELQKRRAMLSDAVYKYSVLMSTLVSKLDRNEDAPVVARKAVYPGTVVEICRSSFRVEEPRGPTRFRLDRDSGRVIAEDYSDAEKDDLETVEPAGE
ncbi:MAG: FapA family protein, partial [Spirochaetota bacterium]